MVHLAISYQSMNPNSKLLCLAKPVILYIPNKTHRIWKGASAMLIPTHYYRWATFNESWRPRRNPIMGSDMKSDTEIYHFTLWNVTLTCCPPTARLPAPDSLMILDKQFLCILLHLQTTVYNLQESDTQPRQMFIFDRCTAQETGTPSQWN